MQYGVCIGPDQAALAGRLGYEFFEMTVGGLLKPTDAEDAFRAVLAEVRRAPIPCPVVNCFVPGNLPIVGPNVDLAALERHVRTVCRRGREAGLDTIVFGSGGARRIPEGFDRAQAGQQLIAFGKLAAAIAHEHGITLAVEPLNKKECNVLVAVQESADYVRAVNHPGCMLLVDGYHWALDHDAAAAIVANGPLFRHTHIATVPARLCPGAEPCDLAPFFTALRQAKYQGRLSIEAKITNPEQDLRVALQVMREAAGR
jgi:sugar phosphate isomerase/epimerase